MNGTADAAAPRPFLLIRGDPSPEELAALVAALAAAGRTAPAPAPSRTSAWADRERLLRAPHIPGPGGWRASALPR